MLALENADEILQILDRFTKQKSKDIPPELEEYINYVAKTGDTVYRWPTVQYLFREKLRNVIKDFHDTTASIEDLPQCPNVDQFNYESMKTLLFERFDNFQAAPFTIQRLCELLTDPKKHYSPLDKFMRALEKNILVVSTGLPGRKPTEDSNDTHQDPLNQGINIDSDMNKNSEKACIDVNGDEHIKPTENHNDNNLMEHTDVEVTPSSSTSHASSDNDVKIATVAIVEELMPEKLTESEQPALDAEKVTVEKEAEKETSSTAEPIETKPVDKVEETPTQKMDSDSEVPKVDETVPTVESTKADTTESVQNENGTKEHTDESVVLEEKKVDEEVNVTPTKEIKDEPIVSEKPPTPKRPCSDDDEDIDPEDASNNPVAKKIRLDNETENVEAKPEEQFVESIVAEVESQKEADILDSVDTKIDEEKEKELLADVVDSALATEKDSINIDTQPIEANKADSTSTKVTEELPTPENLLKTDEPVASIPADLDFTPDEALNELVSSEILAVIPEQPAEEVKMSEEPASSETVGAPVDMAVENNETTAPEVENAMESAPIKADEEQMDVNESNSVDAMDL